MDTIDEENQQGFPFAWTVIRFSACFPVDVLDFPCFAEDLCVLAFFDHFTFNHCCLVSDLHVDCEVVWDRADLAMLLKASRLSATGVSGWYC